MKSIIFTKDRPLQFTALIESMLYNTEISPLDIVVISPHDQYDTTWYYDLIKWEKETHDFDTSIRSVIANIDSDLVLFCCDDVIWINHSPKFSHIRTKLANPAIAGFSLRLGRSVMHRPSILTPQTTLGSNTLSWNFRHLDARWHWAYPFDVSSSVYRKQDVLNYLNDTPGKISGPNAFEDYGSRWFFAHSEFMFLSCHYKQCAVAQDVNRCQDLYQNPVKGGTEHSVSYLKKLYQDGFRLDWRAAQFQEFNDTHIGTDAWSITTRQTAGTTNNGDL